MYVSITYVCVYMYIFHEICIMYFFFADISAEMKACKVLIYHLVLLVLQWPVCQVQGPILEMLSKFSLMSDSSSKRKQFK